MTGSDAPTEMTARIGALPATPQQPAVQTMPDGTRVEYDADGNPTRQWNPDGSVRTYQPDGTSTEQLPDGTSLYLDQSGKPVREVAPDGTTYTSFDGQGRPTSGVTPAGAGFTLSYDAQGDVFEKLDDGTVLETDPGGKPIREVTPDGTTYTSFDDRGRPTGGVSANGSQFTLSYDAQGDVFETFDNGTVLETDPGGKPIREVAPDGTTYTSFDGGGRPTSGVTASGIGFTITYDAQGDAFEKFDDGTVLETDPGGKPIREVAPDGTTYTSFDGGGRPTSGVTASGIGFTITYDAQGDVFEKFDDGTVLETDPGGKPIREVAPDGTTYTSFDGGGRPTSGVTASGIGFTITYDAQGDAFEKFDDGSVLETDPSGKPIRQIAADGTTYTDFDGQGRPTRGTTPNGLGFTITYDPSGGATETFDDGSVMVTDPSGKPIKEVTADGTTFTGFDDKGRPTAGVTKDGHPFTITYDDQGDAFEHNDDGSVVEIGPDGKVIKEVTADGTTFTGFDDKGRPTAGVTKDGHPFTITYDDQGDAFEHNDDGSVVEIGPDGKVIKIWTPDGTEIDFAVEIPALHDAIGKVSAERDLINADFTAMKGKFATIESLWQSPAGASFPPLADTFNTVTQSLLTLLDDAIHRMQTAYENYVNTENTNVQNLN